MYQRKNDRADGVYWTTIPRSVLAFDDESIEPCISVPESVPSTESVPDCVPSTEQKAEQESYTLRNGKVTGIDPPPNPIPVPVPKEKRSHFVKPSLQEVKSYCQERRNRVNPEQFVDHYEANGWVQGKGKPIRDWKAAVRTWERNGVQPCNAKPFADELKPFTPPDDNAPTKPKVRSAT